MKKNTLPYDNTNPLDIEIYAKDLLGKTFYDVLKNFFENGLIYECEINDCKENSLEQGFDTYKTELDTLENYYNNPRSKGSLGNLIEKYYFLYEPNSESEPDFPEAGLELKVMPYEITKSKKYKAGERLVVKMIPNREEIECDFFESSLFNKIKSLLLVLYLRNRKIPRIRYRIDYVKLFSLLSEECKADLEVIVNDYKIITDKIVDGRAHELSESDTRYLGACTKGVTAQSSLQPQYYSEVPAKRRAFSLKQGYMTYVINHYIREDICTYDSALTLDELKRADFDIEIVNKINHYIGYSEEQLYKKFNILASTKQKNNLAVCRMLGVKTDRVAEFEKADIKIKTIRRKKNGVPKENMSFPSMVIRDFVEEKFEDSKIYRYFTELRFLFVVFDEDENGVFKLSGAKFWNMPISELEGTGEDEWEMYQKKFKDGVNFTFKRNVKGRLVVYNDLPKAKETTIFHIRPHAQKSGYIIDGKKYGVGMERDMDELPNGDKMTKQCFWLNNDYVAKIINNI